MKFNSKEEAQQHHLHNYNSDGVAKGRYKIGTPEFYLGRFIVANTPRKSMHLDVGSNTGAIGLMLKYENNCYVKGIELVPALVKKCNKNGIPCFQGSAEDLSRFPDGKFRSITIIEVLEHVFDPSVCIKEALRVLKVGGSLICSFPQEEELGHHHNKIYTIPEIQELFNKFDIDYKLIGIADFFDKEENKKAKWIGVSAIKKEAK